MPDVKPVAGFSVAEIENRLSLDDVFTEQITEPVLEHLLWQARRAARVAEDSRGDEAATRRAIAERDLLFGIKMSGHLNRVVTLGAEEAVIQLKLRYKTTTDGNDFRREMLSWANARAGELINQINETTMKQIRAAVSEALAAREGPRRLAEAVRDKVQGLGQLTATARASAIARTETHNAAAHGAERAAQVSGVPYWRVWLSAEDARTRFDHAAAHGQKRGPDESFNIGGFAMMRPGQGPAAQTVNCRCVLGYRPLRIG